MHKRLLRHEQFPVTKRIVYFNHAAVGPLPDAAFQAMQQQALQQRDYGAFHWREWLEQYSKFRAAAARLIGASASEISILKNTSEGLSFVAEGLRWKEGENVITTDMEFPSNHAPWKRLERRGVECRLIETKQGAFSVADLERLIDSKTRVVALSAVSFHNGFAPDLVAIGELCSDRGVLFCVDAIQSLGARELNVKQARISFLAADGHKWMLGPEGTAIFYASEEVRDRLEVFESGWMNVARGSKFIGASTALLDDGRRFEAGSLNTNGIYGLTASITLLSEIGIPEIEAEVLRLSRSLAARLTGIGFEVASPFPIQSGIVAARPSSVDLRRLSERMKTAPAAVNATSAVTLIHAMLEQERIICAPREGMLRFSPHFYNDENEIDEVIDVLRTLVD